MSEKAAKSTELTSGKILVKLLRWSRRYWVWYIGITIFVVLSSLIPVGYAEGMRQIVNAVAAGSLSDLGLACLLLVGAKMAGLIFPTIRAWITQRLSNRTTLEMQREIIGRLTDMPLLRYAKWHSGDKIQRVNDSAVSAQKAVNRRIPEMLQEVLSILLLFTYLTILSWKLVAGALVLSLIFPLFSNLLSKKVRYWQKYTNKSQAKQDAKLQDQMQGAEVVRSFNLRTRFTSKWGEMVEETRKSGLKVFIWQAISGTTVSMGALVGQFYFLSIGAWLFMNGEIELGVIVAFLFSYERLFYPLSYFMNLWVSIQDALAHAGRVFEMTDISEKAEQYEGYAAIPEKSTVTFDQISFAYEEDQPVLHELSLTIPHGKMTAIVGESGGGKSTIAKLLLGLYSPTEGHIYIGDTKLEKENMGTWRSQIAYVPQDTALFDATVTDNIRIGNLQATEEEIRHAAILAQADEFIQNLPDQYDTRLGERGLRLSGGERQRIAIARAYLRNPELIVLDEPTSALDGWNELMLQQALDELMQGRTVVVIAHRLSTIRHADQIVVVDQGKVVETGTHEELVEKQGYYYELLKAGNQSDDTAGKEEVS